MHFHSIIIVEAALALSLANAQNISQSVALLNGLPPCTQPCIASGLAATGCKITDIYCLCNSPVFTNVTGRCEAETCSMAVIEEITAKIPIICAPAGGYMSSIYTAKIPNAPACANNCTSTALAFSQCAPDNLTCICTSPRYLNAYGPCVSAICAASDYAALRSSSYATCAAVGGPGPYNASLIGGYLNDSVPNGVSQTVPLATSTTTSSPAAFTGGAEAVMAAGELQVALGVVLGLALFL